MALNAWAHSRAGAQVGAQALQWLLSQLAAQPLRL
jgi:hypothetical protein